MDFEKHDCEDRRDQKSMQLSRCVCFCGPGNEFRHPSRRVKRRRCFEHNPDLFSGLVKRGNVVRLGLVIATMMRVSFAVLEQIAMQLLDVVFGERDLFPRLEEQLHRFGVTS